MNQKTIALIVGLMAAAVIGVILVQIDLIRTTMVENEERFDKSVNEALNRVVSNLEVQDNNFGNASYNGFMEEFLKNPEIAKLVPEPSRVLYHPQQQVSNQDIKARQQYVITQIAKNPKLASLFGQGIVPPPIEERIVIDELARLMKQEFSKRDINPDDPQYDYHYGIYSTQKLTMVIIDGHFAVEDGPIRASNTDLGEKSLYNPDYKIPMFTEENPVPGELRVFFPNKRNIILSTLWKNFLGTLVFSALIISCFAYTINIIWRQKKVSEMKTDFINNMTHEFKTPIATISLATDSIINPGILGHPEKVQRFVNIIKQENKRMNSQVEKVLQMALIDKRDFSLKLVPINLHEVIQAALENINLRVEKREGSAKAVLDATNPIVEGDLTHVSNMINNLLDNAEKYSAEKPEITILSRNVPNGVEITVQDKGIGMSKEARKQIFDKFYRVSTGNLHDVKGFGLGLSYVKAMMTAHKGQVEVKSELGKGSSFMLTFPFHVEP
jgi:two-component system, OmpR family, phosphate regulon sensor histidine kinase PhoR